MVIRDKNTIQTLKLIKTLTCEVFSIDFCDTFSIENTYSIKIQLIQYQLSFIYIIYNFIN